MKINKLNIPKQLFLIIGGPGSGKTSSSKKIIEKRPNIAHFSMGEIFRNEVEKRTELGKILASFINKGQYVPIEVAISSINTAITESPKSIVIIDGFPRNEEQMLEFEKCLSKTDEIDLKQIIEIYVNKEIAKKRISSRNRGIDDNLDLFEERINIYENEIESIRTFYSNKKLLSFIDGNNDLQHVSENLLIKIDHNLKPIQPCIS